MFKIGLSQVRELERQILLRDARELARHLRAATEDPWLSKIVANAPEGQLTRVCAGFLYEARGYGLKRQAHVLHIMRLSVRFPHVREDRCDILTNRAHSPGRRISDLWRRLMERDLGR